MDERAIISPLDIASLGRDVLVEVHAVVSRGLASCVVETQPCLGGGTALFVGGWLRVPDAIDIVLRKRDFPKNFKSEGFSSAAAFEIIRDSRNVIELLFRQSHKVSVSLIEPIFEPFAECLSIAGMELWCERRSHVFERMLSANEEPLSLECVVDLLLLYDKDRAGFRFFLEKYPKRKPELALTLNDPNIRSKLGLVNTIVDLDEDLALLTKIVQTALNR